MGIVNVTPDSFSDGGDNFDTGRAIAHGQHLAESGADLIDVGGESTRPGASPVPLDEELRRVRPVVRALADAGLTVSIDTRHAAVMAAAIDAGAKVVNDITGLTWDAKAAGLVAEAGAAVVLMHMQGTPQTMQADPSYADVLVEVLDWLEDRVTACEAAGIPRSRIAVDPGIGFGKTVDHNLALLAGVATFHGLGTAVLVGLSRKAFIAKLSRGEAPKDRLAGSLAGALACARAGVQFVRVHDVAETAQALAIERAIRGQPA